MNRTARTSLFGLLGLVLLSPACGNLGEPDSTAMVAQAERVPSADVPAAVAVPDDNKLSFEALGVGVQIYSCNLLATGAYGWVFVAPDATLYRDGEIVGIHYAGPTWEANNGGKVVGSVVTRNPSPDGAIPWLLLKAASHDGPGLFSDVTYLQRLATTGGTAPTTGCDGAHAGDVARVPYTAAYEFYKAHNQ